MSLTYDINSEKWFSCWKLNPLANPEYYEQLFKYFRSLVVGMDKSELIYELNELLAEKIEKPMGASYQSVLYVYKNLPSLSAFTKSNNPEFPDEYVRKYTIKKWLDEIEAWIFEQLILLEPNIKFRDGQKLM